MPLGALAAFNPHLPALVVVLGHHALWRVILVAFEAELQHRVLPVRKAPIRSRIVSRKPSSMGAGIRSPSR